MHEMCACVCSGCLRGLQNLLAPQTRVGKGRRFARQKRREARSSPRREDSQSFAWKPQNQNVQVAARVRCASMKLVDEYNITDVVLGIGMSGSVMLASRMGSTDTSPEMRRQECFSPAELPKGDAFQAAAAPVEGIQSPAHLRSRMRMPSGGAHPEAHAASVAGLLDLAGYGGDATEADEETYAHVARDSQSTASAGTLELVAVKTLAKNGLSEAQLASLLMEVDIYLKMDHINIVKLIGVFDEPEKMYLVMEYCTGGDLSDRLARLGRFPDSEAASAIRQVVSAVNYCHRHPSGKVCHRDLKHSNFIFASEAAHAPLKLADFGLSRVLSPDKGKMRSCAGTVEYMAPEIILRKKYDESCDMWSIGVIAYSLLCGKAPFSRHTEEQTAKAIAEADLPPLEGDLWDGVTDQAKHFVRQLLQANAASRPSAEQALQSAWLSHTAERRKEHQLASIGVLDKVRRFAHENHVRRAVAAMTVYSTAGGSLGERENLVEAFRELDVDGDGVISASELVLGLRQALGISHEEAQWIFNQLDTDGDARIHFHEFMTAATGANVLQQGSIEEAFSKFDLDRNGTIELPELETMLGTQFCGTPTHQIFAELDKNGDNSVDLREFSSMLKGESRSRSVTPTRPSFHMAENTDGDAQEDLMPTRLPTPSALKRPLRPLPLAVGLSSAVVAKNITHEDKGDQCWSRPIDRPSCDYDSDSNINDSTACRLVSIPRMCSAAAHKACGERALWPRGGSSDAESRMRAHSVLGCFFHSFPAKGDDEVLLPPTRLAAV